MLDLNFTPFSGVFERFLDFPLPLFQLLQIKVQSFVLLLSFFLALGVFMNASFLVFYKLSELTSLHHCFLKLLLHIGQGVILD